jgi:hypothetical protein
MKKVFLVTAFAGFSLASLAQLTFAPKIGFGLTSSSFSGSSGGVTTSIPSQSAFNFNVGAEARYRLTDVLSIHSGLFYDNIQSKNELTETQLGTIFSISLANKMSFISLPLQLVYGKEGTGFYGGAGLNFALGVGGTYTAVENDGTGPMTNTGDIKFDGNDNASDNDEHLKALNLGIALKAGYAFNSNVFAGVDAIIGLSNLAPGSDGSYKLTTFGVHVGYVLSSSSKK